MPRPTTLSIAMLLCAFATSCAPVDDAELLRVHRVSPDRIEPGHPLRIRGDAFPPGRTARVELAGVFHAPGREPSDVRVELTARAVSAEHVVARFDRAELASFGGRGTLRGRAIVSFDASDGGRVFGRSPPIVIDVGAAGAERLGRELAERRSAEELARGLGITLADEAPGRSGLPIVAVHEGSVAARAGLVIGDRVTALGDLRLHAPSDFLSPPDATVLALWVLRDGDAAPREVRLPRATITHGIDRATLRVGQAVLAWILFTLVFIAPTASFAEWLSRPRSGPRRSRMSLAASFGGFVALGAIGRTGIASLSLEVVALGWLLACALRGLAAPAPRPLDRVITTARAVAIALAGLVVFGAVAALAGTSELSALVAAQGREPWEWTAFRAPTGLACIALAALAGAPTSDAPSALDRAIGFASSATVAATLLGGWSSPSDELPARMLGVGLFGAKAFACDFLIHRIGARWAHQRRAVRGLVIGALTSLVAVGTAMWIAFGAPHELGAALGEVMCVMLGATLLAVIVRRAVGRHELGVPTPSHPFL